MMQGMTGFGTRVFSCRGRRYLISIRSVNHKYLDLVMNVPEGLLELEQLIKKAIAKAFHRGRITFQLSSTEPAGHNVLLNKPLLIKYFHLMKTMSKSLGVPQDIRLRDIVMLPEVISVTRCQERLDKTFITAFTPALQACIHDVVRMRQQEGRTIRGLLGRHSHSISRKIQVIKKRLATIIEQQKKRLTNDELRDFLRSSNIQEELERLEFHLKSFDDTVVQASPLGKVLDFMTQEMQREINTLSAKLRDARVSYLSVLIKDEVETLREQLQNVE